MVLRDSEHAIDDDRAPAGTHTVRVEVTDLVGAPAARHVAVREFVFVNVSLPITDATSPQGTLGFEDWQSYDDHPTGAGSAAHVNLTSGNALWSHTFLENPGRGIDSVGRLTYNSQEPGLLNALPLLNGIPLVSGLISSDYNQVGRGFSLQVSGVTRLNQPLEFVGVWLLNPTPTSVRLVDGDGTRHTFTQVTPGQPVYQGPPGTHLRLRAFNSSGPRRWAMTRPDGVTYFFDADGYITQVADRVGNVMAFEYQSVPLTEQLYTQCGRPSALLVAGCPKRVIRITDASGVAEGAANRSVHVAYVPFSLTQPAAGMIDSISDHAGRVTKFGYDNQRRLQTVTEAAGTPVQRSFSLTYDASSSGYLHTVTDPRGSTSKIAYEPQGLLQTSLRRMTGFADRATRGTTYGYARTTLDGATVSNAVITDPKGRVTQVRTDGRQRLVEHVDARAKRDRWTWDDAVNKPRRHVEAQGTADEAITKWEWGSLGQLRRAFEPFKADGEAGARYTDFDYRLSTGPFPGSDQALVVYDLTELVPPKGAAGPAERARFHTTWAVDGLGRVMSMCEPKQACHGYTYVPGTGGVQGLVETVTDPMGNVVRYAAHDPSGLAREVTDERGKKWGLDYDGVGNLLAVRDPRGTGDATPITDPADRPYTARYGYDELNRKISATIPKRSALGQFVRRSFEYDANGNRRIVTDGTNAVWRTEYTVTDQPQVEVSPAVEHDGESGEASAETFFEYDATDQISVVRRPQGRAENANGFLTRYVYDDVDQMIVERRVSDEPTPAGGIHQLVTSWAYDLRGNRTGVADPNANVEVDDQTAAANAADPGKQRFAYGYDVADRREREVEDPDDLGLTTTSTYDVHDNLRTVTSPRGHDPDEPNTGNFTTTYDYDDQDLRIGATDPLGRHTEWKRRKDGRVTEITSPRGTVTADPNDFVMKLEYDAAGDLRRRTLPRAPNQYGPDVIAVTYTRDDVGDPVAVEDARGHTFTNAFLDTGQLRGTDRPSWWIYDDEQGMVRERTDQDPRPSAAGRDLPGEQGHGDFGKTEPQDLPDLLPRRGQTTLGYDDELRLTSVTDATGIRQELGHDAVGRMTSRTIPYKGTAPDESRTSCAPGVEGGEPTTGAIQITWRYDRNGNRRSMRDGRCQETTWAYDQFDRLLTTTSPAGWGDSRAITTLSLDRNGNTLKRALPRDPEHAFERMTYDAADRIESFVEPFDADAPRSEWRYRYDANDNRIREIRPRSLDPGVVDQASFTTRMTYDEADQLQSSTNGAGHVTELDYDRDGNQVEVRAPGAARASGAGIVSRVTRRTFDGRGLLWTETTGSGSDARTTVTEYDANGNLRRVVNPRGVGTNGLPEHADIGPDVAMSTATMANWHASVNEYTEDDLLRARYLPKDGADGEDRWKQTTTYTEQGWPLEVSEVFRWTGSNSAQVRTRYTHLPTGWVSEIVDKDGSPNPQQLIYDYDLAGNQTLWASPGRTRRVEREFFANGELQQRRAIRTRRDGQPVTGETRTYDYARNPAGELTELVDRNAPRADPGQPATRVTSVTRDVAGRITDVNESWDGGRDTSYRYRTGGLIADVQVDGRIVDDVYTDGRKMAYEYDILDRVKEVRVHEATQAAAQDRITTTMFWPSGAQRELTKANGTVETRYFATDGRITSRTSTPEGSSATTHDYDYDPNGNRSTDERGEYEYNARDQLTHWDKAGAGSTANPDRQVTYLPAGDGRLQGTTERFSAPGAVSTTRTTENTYQGERLVSASVATTAADGGAVPDGHRQLRYDYDVFGSLLTIKTAMTSDPTPPDSAFETTTQYTYDSFERLLSSRDDADDDGEADGDHEVYCYDALDRRDRRLTGITRVENTDPDSFEAQRTACLNRPEGAQTLDYSYLGLGEQLTRENTSTGRGPRTYDYTPDGTRLGQRGKASSSSATKFRPYETDAQGNVVALEDPNQDENTPGDDDGDPAPEPNDGYQLDPYGSTGNETQLSTVAKDNPFRYQGHYLDPASGTYDMQARAYRPALGRFLTQDRFEDPSADLTLQQDPLTNNRYAFLAGNPTNSLEWDGHCNGPLINPDTKPLCKRELIPKHSSLTPTGVKQPPPAGVEQQRMRRVLPTHVQKKLARIGIPRDSISGLAPVDAEELLLTHANASEYVAVSAAFDQYQHAQERILAQDDPSIADQYMASFKEMNKVDTSSVLGAIGGSVCAVARCKLAKLGRLESLLSPQTQARLRDLRRGFNQRIARIRATKGGAEAAGAPRRIFSARVLVRSAEESGPFHNFPASFDDDIFERGTRTVTKGFWKKPRAGMSNDSVQYRLRGELNGRSGTYEIFARPSASGRTEVINHRFFNPD